jgi:hypothetical protein
VWLSGASSGVAASVEAYMLMLGIPVTIGERLAQRPLTLIPLAQR